MRIPQAWSNTSKNGALHGAARPATAFGSMAASKFGAPQRVASKSSILCTFLLITIIILSPSNASPNAANINRYLLATAENIQYSANGERLTVNGERTTVNGERTTVNGERTTVNGERTTVNGKRTTLAGLSKHYVICADQDHEILCEAYRVPADEELEGLLRRRGDIADRNFDQFMAIFRRLNPDVTELDAVAPDRVILIPLKILDENSLPGQASGEVTLPLVPVGRDLAMDDGNTLYHPVEKGDTVNQILMATYGVAYNTPEYHARLATFRTLNPDITDLNHIDIGQTLRLAIPKTLQPRATEGPRVFPETPAYIQRLQELAAVLNARLIARGIYYFPDAAQSDMSLPMLEFPMLEYPGGRRIVLGLSAVPSAARRYVIERFWPDVRFVSISPDFEVPALAARLQPAIPTGNHLTFYDEGVSVRLNFSWQQLLPDDDPAATPATLRRILLMALRAGEVSSPPTLLRYLDIAGITVRDIYLESEAPLSDDRPIASSELGPSIQTDPATLLDAATPRVFLRELTRVLGYEFFEDIIIPFNYENTQVSALTSMIVAPYRAPVLVDWGNFQGESGAILPQQGFKVLVYDRHTPPFEILKQLLQILGHEYTINPEIRAVQRPESNNIFITIPGIMLHHREGHARLFTPTPLQTHLRNFLLLRGIRLYQWDEV